MLAQIFTVSQFKACASHGFDYSIRARQLPIWKDVPINEGAGLWLQPAFWSGDAVIQQAAIVI